MPRKKALGTLEADLQAHHDATNVIPFPKGVHFDSEEALTLWAQFTRARPSTEWRDMDLVMLARAVRLEIRIRELDKDIDQNGATTENKRGTPVENPDIRAQKTLSDQQLGIFRMLSLGVRAAAAEPANNRGVRSTQQPADFSEDDFDSLLAH